MNSLKGLFYFRPEVVAGFLSKIIRRGNNGSVWIVDQGEVYKMKFPSLEEVKKASEKYDF